MPKKVFSNRIKRPNTPAGRGILPMKSILFLALAVVFVFFVGGYEIMPEMRGDFGL